MILDKRSYSVSRNEKSHESVYFEYDQVDGYQVKPKVSKKDEIEVSKIVFVNDSMSEKIIRKKIDKKINNLLLQLHSFDENGDDEDGIKRSLMDAEKLRLQIINNYVKYLGNTYQSLTIKKIQIIINQLRFRLYKLQQIERYNNMMNMNSFEQGYESRRGR